MQRTSQMQCSKGLSRKYYKKNVSKVEFRKSPFFGLHIGPLLRTLWLTSGSNDLFQSAEKSVRLPMMMTTASVPYIDRWKFSAIALPLSEGSNAGNFIIVLPKTRST